MKTRPFVSVVSVCLFLFFLPSIAHAQATRTWVSGVGDDVNPCSRTAPCKTFAGAISKTAPGGEIDVLDPGGFGAVTITKSISIEADGVIAGVLVSGTNGIVIQVPAGASVTLRGLTIEGLGTGINGVRFLGGGSLQVEHCYINGFTTAGIDFEPNTAATLFVRDSMITNNAGGGVIVAPTGGATAQGSVENTLLDRNLFGLRVQADGKIDAKNVTASNHSNAGFTSVTTGDPSVLTVDNCTAINNGTNGVRSDGGQAIVRLTNSTIIGNVMGMSAANGGQLISFGNNHNDGNGQNGSPTQTLGGS
jgi:hypothetical protein